MSESAPVIVKTALVPMPAEIAKAIIAIKRGLDPAKQTASDGDGERQFSYASADDVFAACQKEMAGAGILIEMLDEGFELLQLPGEDGLLRTSVHMQFLPVIVHESGASYENPRNRVHMVGPYEGMRTCAGLRTLAEKTYLRSLFKLPSAPNGEGRPDGEREANGGLIAPYASQIDVPQPAEPSARKTKVSNPFQLDKQKSAAKREEIITALMKAADIEGDPEARLREVTSTFRAAQADWVRLAPPDQQLVKNKVGELNSKIANSVAA